MTADDLTRRAIIAAHDASCPERCEATHMASLSKREEAIVELWRADVEQARTETAEQIAVALVASHYHNAARIARQHHGQEATDGPR